MGLILFLLVVAAIGAAWWFHVALFAWLAVALAFGTPLFWSLIVAESCLLFWALDYEDDTDPVSFATVVLFATLLLFQFFSEDLKPFTFWWEHPVLVAAILAVYLLIGAFWSVAKWWFAETARVRRARADFDTWEARYGRPDIPRPTWAEYAANHKTRPAEHKARFVAWIAFWPWSLLWTLINDPLKRAATRIYEELLGTYQRITDRAWRV